MRDARRVVTVVALFLVVSSAGAGATVIINGNTLLFELKRDMVYWESPSQEGREFFGQGISYVRGVLDAVWLLEPDGTCVPKDASNLELATAIVDQLEKSQELRDASKAAAVIAAIQAEWPCPGVEPRTGSSPLRDRE